MQIITLTGFTRAQQDRLEEAGFGLEPNVSPEYAFSLTQNKLHLQVDQHLAIHMATIAMIVNELEEL